MKLTGTYTAAGAALETRISAGQCGLVITRAAAAAGPTADDAPALANERQDLPILGAARAGTTFTVRAQLVSAAAAAAYVLSEVGLYAQGESGEILYRIYRLDEPVAVDPAAPLTAELSLAETVLSGSETTAVVSPAGLATPADCLAAAETFAKRFGAAQSLSCTGAQLAGVLGALPNPLTCDVTVTVTDAAIPGPLILQNLCGEGTLTVRAAARAVLSGYLLVQDCTLREIAFRSLTVTAAALCPVAETLVYDSAAHACAVAVRNCRRVCFDGVEITAPAALDGSVGFYFYRSEGALRAWSAKKRLFSCCVSGFSSLRLGIAAASDAAAGSSYTLYAGDNSFVFSPYMSDGFPGSSQTWYLALCSALILRSSTILSSN